MILLMCLKGNQLNRAVMLNSKVIDYINFILRAGEYRECPTEKVGHQSKVTCSKYTTVSMFQCSTLCQYVIVPHCVNVSMFHIGSMCQCE